MPLQRVALTEASAVGPGEVKRCLAPGFAPFAVYNIDGEYFVTEDTCTHGMASLSEGELDGHVIECPFHGGAFDVKTGEPVERPCVAPLKTYPAILENGTIWTEAVAKPPRPR